MAEAGFRQIDLQDVERIVEVKRGRKVLADPFLPKHSSSRLALLSEEAYQAGLQRIEAAIREAEARGETAAFHTDIRIEMLSGRKV